MVPWHGEANDANARMFHFHMVIQGLLFPSMNSSVSDSLAIFTPHSDQVTRIKSRKFFMTLVSGRVTKSDEPIRTSFISVTRQYH